MYSITSKLNSTFGTIGKAMVDKMTAKVVGKLKLLLLLIALRINLNMLSCSETRLQNFEQFLPPQGFVPEAETRGGINDKRG